MTRSLKVLQIVSSLSVGGAERLIPGLVRHIDRERFALHVCSVASLLGDRMRGVYEELGVPLTLLKAKRFYAPRVVTDLVRYIRAHEIDLVHTHLTDADVPGRIAARLAGVPVVSTLHNVPLDYNRQKIHRRTLQRFTAHYVADRLIAVSERIRTMYIEQWRIHPARIVAIRNAVPLEPYLALPEWQPAPRADGPLITTIGRLAVAKAQHLLLEAAVLVLRQRPDARFMLVGQGDREQPLRDQAAALGLAERVTFAGLRHDIPAVLGQTDIFTLSSLWEGLPVTAVEAMAAARPCVLTDVGGARDLIDHGTHGLIVPPNAVPALATALLALLDDPTRAAAMGRAARLRIKDDFSLETYVRQHEQLYERVVAGRRPMRRGVQEPVRKQADSL